jgi:hypothetical protein
MTSELSDPFDLQRFVDAQNPVYEGFARNCEAGRSVGTGSGTSSRSSADWDRAIWRPCTGSRRGGKRRRTWTIRFLGRG